MFGMHLPAYVYRVLFGRYRPLKLPLRCEIVQEGNFGPSICTGRDTPHFRHAFSNRTYFRSCGRIWLSSVQRAPRVADENKRRRKKEESVVKHKYVCTHV